MLEALGPLGGTPAEPLGSNPGAAVDLSLLLRLTSPELDALYRRASVPSSLSALNGTPRGKVLALVSPLWLTLAPVQAFASSRLFPWQGKSFKARPGADRGSGINRVVPLGDVMPFDTFVGTSKIDGRPAIVLDYDRPENPWFVRRIYDELRQVAEHLFLGAGMLKSKSGPKLAAYFVIDGIVRSMRSSDGTRGKSRYSQI